MAEIRKVSGPVREAAQRALEHGLSTGASAELIAGWVAEAVLNAHYREVGIQEKNRDFVGNKLTV